MIRGRCQDFVSSSHYWWQTRHNLHDNAYYTCTPKRHVYTISPQSISSCCNSSDTSTYTWGKKASQSNVPVFFWPKGLLLSCKLPGSLCLRDWFWQAWTIIIMGVITYGGPKGTGFPAQTDIITTIHVLDSQIGWGFLPFLANLSFQDHRRMCRKAFIETQKAHTCRPVCGYTYLAGS